MTTMHREPANDNSRADEAAIRAFRRALDARVGPDASFAEREHAGLELANEMCRADQERDLARRASRWRSLEIEVDGVRYRRHSEGTVVYHGLCGPLAQRRWLYREVGVHNGRTTVPLELDAGLMEGATPALAYAITRGYGEAPSRQVHEAMEAHMRTPPSRSTTERIAKAIAGQMFEALPRLEPVVREQEELPKGARGITVGLDRTSVPMEELAAHAVTRRRRKKPYERKPPEPIEVNYRMAYVGTVSIVDGDGRALVTRRYSAPAEDGPEDIVARMMADVRHARSLGPRLRVGVLQDGAPEMWNLVCSGLRELVNVRKWYEAIDRHHVLERLADVLAICKFTQAWRADKLAGWNDQLDRDDGAIDEIRRHVRQLYDTHRGDTRRALEKHDTYFENNHERMRYASLRAAGLPVASGVTEGACKSLVMIRAKRCGQRWHVAGIRSVLTVRALDMSDRLRPVFDLFAHDYTASIKVAA
jgi:hypothetical protein